MCVPTTQLCHGTTTVCNIQSHIATMAQCRACGALLEHIEYQSRAADEAHTTIDACPFCPIDAHKLSRRGSVRSERVLFSARKPHSHRRGLSAAGARCGECTIVDIRVEPDYYTSMATPESEIRECTRAIGHSLTEAKSLHGYEIQSPIHRRVVYLREDTWEEGLGIVMSRVSMFSVGTPADRRSTVVTSKIKVVDVDNDSVTFARNSVDPLKPGYFATKIFYKSPCDRSISSFISRVYGSGGLMKSLNSFTQAGDTRALANLSPRAWDVNSVGEGNYIYTTKVDGERRWLVLHGRLGYVVRKDQRLTLCGWYIIPHECAAGHTQARVVIDCEYTPTEGLAFIDMLTDSSGGFSPVDRCMKWSVDEFKRVVADRPTLPVHLRSYHSSMTEVRAHTTFLSSPSDGVMAIDIASTSARKLKTLKSIELAAIRGDDGRMLLVTSDGFELFEDYTPPLSVQEGSIVELRVSLAATGTEMTVHSAIIRVDKAKANDSSAVSQIIQSAMESHLSGDQNDRRRALLWCNSVRSDLNRMVESMDVPRTIVLDVGSGDGQSIDSMRLNSGKVSRILVEPDRGKYVRLCRRIGVRPHPGGCGQLRPMVRSLKARKVPVVAVNCTLREVLGDPDLMQILGPELRAVVATFSIQFVLSDLYSLHRRWRTPIYGCGYVYDGVNVGECLIDGCGVQMRRISPTECSVAWGSDRVYKEPYTTSSDYRSFTCVGSASKVLNKGEGEKGRHMQICSKLMCFTPRV